MFFSEQQEAYGPANQTEQEVQQEAHTPSAEEAFDILEESIEGSLTEAEKRLEKAQFYKAVMKGGFFGQNQSTLAKEVETEIRKFATERMNILLGISQAPQPVQAAKLPFTDQEIIVLKKIIDTAMKRFNGGGNGPPVVTPVAVQPVVEQVQVVQTAPNSQPQQPQQQVKRPPGRPRKNPIPVGGIPTPTKEQMEAIMQRQGMQAQMAPPQVIITESKG